MLSPREATQQRIAQAQANAAAARPQESDGKSASSGPGAPRSFLGGNLEVYSALEKIGFQGVLGDASMRGNTAYIRIWKRAGTSQQQSSSAIPVSEFLNDAFDQISRDVNNTFGKNLYNTIGSGEAANVNYLTEDFNYDATIETQFFQPNLARQKALATQIAATDTTLAFETNIATPQTPPSSQPTTDNNAALGTVRSANPNGFINTLGRIGRAVIGLPQGKPDYVGGAEASVTSAPLGEMMWQFLFNPSELELETGPEFKGAETWGVSDKANSGQPLHWTHNKNTQLKFNSVLLNGFVFGRKVEVLEQGLIELFMARDGAGQHGPHVLEFVWGKRSFGPCVIKNINIKEKMWDEGEVVNAELSFTLEQVPEWTINDGAYVDVARPGRRPLQEEATQSSQQERQTGAENKPPGGGTGGDQKSKQQGAQNSQYDFIQCKRVQSDADFTTQLSRRLRSSVSIEPSFGSLPASNYLRAKQQYEAGILNKYKNSPTYKSFFNTRNIPEQCLNPNKIATTNAYNTQFSRRNNSEKYTYDKGLVEQLAACADSIGSAGGPIKALYNNKNCNRFQTNPNSNTERL